MDFRWFFFFARGGGVSKWIKNLKIKAAQEFEPGTSGSAVKCVLINNVNKVHYLYFLITGWLQPCLIWTISGLFTIRSMEILNHGTNSHSDITITNCSLVAFETHRVNGAMLTSLNITHIIKKCTGVERGFFIPPNKTLYSWAHVFYIMASIMY